MRVEFLPEADRELWDGIFWYDSLAPNLGADFWIDVEETMALVIAAPNRWRDYFDLELVHRINLKRFPHCIVYEFDPALDRLVVLAVEHQRKMPGSWATRSR